MHCSSVTSISASLLSCSSLISAFTSNHLRKGCGAESLISVVTGLHQTAGRPEPRIIGFCEIEEVIAGGEISAGKKALEQDFVIETYMAHGGLNPICIPL
jgi:hypothetical protein